MKDIILDTLIDSLKILPFLFIAFLIIEYFEHKLNNKTKKIISKSGKYSPILGSLLGLIPQCGFGVVATNLYITRIISLGTLIGIYLSTSDEMLPIMLSNKAPLKVILLILAIKFITGFIFGYLIDFVLRKKTKNEHVSYDICDDENCGCNHSHNLIMASIIHTLKTLIYLVIITFIINVIFNYLGDKYLSRLLLKDTLYSPLITSLIGLIPSCGSSIMISELYLSGSISFGSLISGLLTNSGMAILVLFKSNKNIKENITILAILYIIGILVGLGIELIKILY